MAGNRSVYFGILFLNMKSYITVKIDYYYHITYTFIVRKNVGTKN